MLADKASRDRDDIAVQLHTRFDVKAVNILDPFPHGAALDPDSHVMPLYTVLHYLPVLTGVAGV